MTEPPACPISGATERRPLVVQRGFQWMIYPSSGYACLDEAASTPTDPPLDYDQVARDYIAGYQTKLKRKYARSRRRAAYLKRRMEGPRLLDVGSNVGIFVAAAHDLGLEAEGVELSQILRDHAARTYPDYRFANTPLEEFETDRTFHGIYCSEVIEHTFDVTAFARRLHELLAPGGVLYLTTPDLNEYRFGTAVTRDLGAPDHRLYFTRANIGKFLERVGFSRTEFKRFTRGGIQLLAWK